MTISALPKGIAFTRYFTALAKCDGDVTGALAIAEASWGESSLPARVLRSAVAAGTTTDSTWAGPLVEYQQIESEFIELLRPLTLLGRISGWHRVPFNIRIPRQSAGATGSWVGQGSPVKVRALAFGDSITMTWAKVGAIVVMAKELIKLSTPAAEARVRDDLAAAVASFLDQQLIDPAIAAVADTSPASITNGITPTASSGTSVTQITSDLAELIDALAAGTNMIAPYFAMSPRLAARLGTKRDTGGTLAFPDIGPRGGAMFGIPVVTSGAFLTDTNQESDIVLLDAAEVLLAEGELTVQVTTQGSLQMDDSPSTGAQPMTSLWQSNLVALKLQRYVNWQRRRDAAVAILTGVAL